MFVLLTKSGTVSDGTIFPRYQADIAVCDGVHSLSRTAGGV